MDIELIRKVAVAVSLLGALVGLVLLVKPDWMRWISRQGGRWISLRKATKVLDTPIDIDNWVIRNGRVIGTLMLLASLFLLLRAFTMS